MSPYLKFLLFLATVLFLTFGLASCARVEPRKPIVFAPVNPDVASVKGFVSQSKASTGKAQDAAGRAVEIVERIVVAPGQEQELEKLKWELSTTIEQLRFTSEFLENANTQIGVLASQVEDCKRWGIEQQQTAQSLFESVKAERSRADAEHKSAFRNGRERDVFITLASVISAVLALSSIKPYLWKIPNPWLIAIGAFASASLAFCLCFWVLRKIAETIVTITI
jgi:hypothetical protein